MEAKKNLLTREGLKKYEDELQDLKVVKRKEVAQKIKEAREQGDQKIKQNITMIYMFILNIALEEHIQLKNYSKRQKI